MHMHTNKNLLVKWSITPLIIVQQLLMTIQAKQY